MKKEKFNGKITLKKETIARLTNFQLEQIKGGEEDILFHSRLLCPASNQDTRNRCYSLEGTTSKMGGTC